MFLVMFLCVMMCGYLSFRVFKLEAEMKRIQRSSDVIWANEQSQRLKTPKVSFPLPPLPACCSSYIGRDTGGAIPAVDGRSEDDE